MNWLRSIFTHAGPDEVDMTPPPATLQRTAASAQHVADVPTAAPVTREAEAPLDDAASAQILTDEEAAAMAVGRGAGEASGPGMGGEAAALTSEIVLDAMHDVIDPELGYNIVDIGLIYECHVTGSDVHILMTMTTPGCPAQDYIMNGVRARGAQIPGLENIEVELTWDPPWSTAKMTPIAKAYFNIPSDPL